MHAFNACVVNQNGTFEISNVGIVSCQSPQVSSPRLHRGVCVRIGKMHASSQSKRICIEHWVVWVDQSYTSSAIASPTCRHGRRGMHSYRDRSCGGWRQPKVRNEGIGIDIFGVHVVDDIGLGVVLLFCTHGFSLGRTKLHKRGRRGMERGQLAELRVMLLESWIVRVLHCRARLGSGGIGLGRGGM